MLTAFGFRPRRTSKMHTPLMRMLIALGMETCKLFSDVKITVLQKASEEKKEVRRQGGKGLIEKMEG